MRHEFAILLSGRHGRVRLDCRGGLFVITYVAFLRAVNVGGRVVKMDALRALISTLKVTNVETFIASGNLLFETAFKQGCGSRVDEARHRDRRISFARTRALLAYPNED